jgi:hypothetical protein
VTTNFNTTANSTQLKADNVMQYGAATENNRLNSATSGLYVESQQHSQTSSFINQQAIEGSINNNRRAVGGSEVPLMPSMTNPNILLKEEAKAQFNNTMLIP